MQIKVSEIVNKLDKKSVFFGPQGFSFPCSVNEQEVLHKTYASDSEWNSAWFVFSQDTELGDPYFVDTSNDLLPVYTAMHGEGCWEVEMVASSLDNFVNCMTILDSTSKQACAQFIPDDATITRIEQLKNLEDQLIATSECEEFWHMFFECYIDWLEDED